ncbi:hypothetical protein [Caudoviricetes sp.]|nr:hypothetical protein [Caudoviricetes sp.]
MGCDIHLYVERNEGGNWAQALPPADWCSNRLERTTKEIKSYDQGKWFWDRHYELFAWLADVRNYHDQEPLADKRGLPENVSAPVKAESDDYGCDGHSHTWFTVAELMAGLEGLVAKHGGAINVIDYAEWKASGSAFPRSWCKSSSAPNISEADFAAGKRPQIEKGSPLAWALFTIECAWEVPGRVAFERFSKLLAELTKLGDPKDTRLVFWFDD